MLLNELFGETARIKILEELLAYEDSFLTAEEISRMADISSKTVYIHMNQLENIGILEVEKKGAKRFKLKHDDERVLALGLIESNEFLRKSYKQELYFESIDFNLGIDDSYLNFNKLESPLEETSKLEFSISI